jgi:hypothetical protein
VVRKRRLHTCSEAKVREGHCGVGVQQFIPIQVSLLLLFSE